MSSQVSLIDGHIDGADTCVICGRAIPEGRQVCVICGHTNRTLTNYDRIRNMSVEEMVDFLRMVEDGEVDYAETFCDLCENQLNCNNCLQQWLESESDTE